MKKFTLTISLIIITLCGVKAQALRALGYVEGGKGVPAVGGMLGFEFANRFEFGGFYQRREFRGGMEGEQPEYASYFGAYIASPLYQTENTALKLNLRAGSMDNKYVNISPGLIFNYNPIPEITFGGGVGVTNLKPIWTLTAGFNLTRNNRIGYTSYKSTKAYKKYNGYNVKASKRRKAFTR